MDPLLNKLQMKPGMTLAVLRTPASLADKVAAWSGEVTVTARQAKSNEAVLCFVGSCAEIASQAPKLAAKLQGDALLWLAYPKKSSKNYASDIGRDGSWGPLGELGFEPVRQVALDADWSALRFRRVEFIKTMKRASKHALSAAGKRKAKR